VLIESIVFRTRDGRFVGIPHEGNATVDPDKFHQFHQRPACQLNKRRGEIR
jgi:hypothetical protein